MVSNAIIIFPDEKGLIPVFGVPIIKRIFTILRQLGINKIAVIGESRLYEKIISKIKDHFLYYPVDNFEHLGGLINKDIFKGRTLVLKANHIIDKTSLKRVLEKCGDKLCALIGKGKDPIFIVSQRDIVSVVEVLWKGEIKKSFLDSIKKIEGIAGLPFSLNSVQEIKEAEKSLINALSLQKRAEDSILAKYFDRNISLFFTKRLVHTGITPNQITLLGMSIGLTGAFLISLPSYWTQLIGSLLFLFCVIVDGMDGEVARLKLKESIFGHYLDIITDNIVHVAIFIGMGYGLYKRTNDTLYLYFIYILLIGFALCAISVYQCILKKDEEELRKSPLLIRLMSLLTNRDFAYLVALLAVIDKLNWFFIGTAIGSYVFSATLWIVSYWYRKNYPADSAA